MPTDFTQFVAELRREKGYRRQIVRRQALPARPARLADGSRLPEGARFRPWPAAARHGPAKPVQAIRGFRVYSLAFPVSRDIISMWTRRSNLT